MNNIITYDWLLEQDIPPLGGQPDAAGMQVPGSPMGAGPGGMEPNIANMPQQDDGPGSPEEMEDLPDDITQDPEAPDMPEDASTEEMNFEEWRNEFIKQSIKGDVPTLKNMISQVIDKSLEEHEMKFVLDNQDILNIRENANVDKVSKEIRRSIKKQIDENNPAVDLVEKMTLALETTPMLNDVFLRMMGLMGSKGDYHRKFIAALLGAIQVGGGGIGTDADLLLEENEFAIEIVTRMVAKFGITNLRKWSLKEDDPERYLSAPEQQKLEAGSPDEREALRKRIVIESIAEQFKDRSFIINSVNVMDGTVYFLGMDFSNMLKSAFTEGKLIVKSKHSENSEAFIDDHGAIIPMVDWYIKYAKETGGQDEDGNPEKEEIDFLEKKDGILFLTASLTTLQEVSTALGQGIIFKELPYRGNQSDIKRLMRCVPSASEILFRNCT